MLLQGSAHSKPESEITFYELRNEAKHLFDNEYSLYQSLENNEPKNDKLTHDFTSTQIQHRTTQGNLGLKLTNLLHKNETSWSEKLRKKTKIGIGVSSVAFPVGAGLAAGGTALIFIFGMTMPFIGMPLIIIGATIGGIALFTFIGLSIYRGINQSKYNKNKETIEKLILDTEENILTASKNTNPLQEDLSIDQTRQELQNLLADKNITPEQKNSILNKIFEFSKIPVEVPSEISIPIEEITSPKVRAASEGALLSSKTASLEQLETDLLGILGGNHTDLKKFEQAIVLIPEGEQKNFIRQQIQQYAYMQIRTVQQKILSTMDIPMSIHGEVSAIITRNKLASEDTLDNMLDKITILKDLSPKEIITVFESTPIEPTDIPTIPSAFLTSHNQFIGKTSTVSEISIKPQDSSTLRNIFNDLLDCTPYLSSEQIDSINQEINQDLQSSGILGSAREHTLNELYEKVSQNLLNKVYNTATKKYDTIWDNGIKIKEADESVNQWINLCNTNNLSKDFFTTIGLSDQDAEKYSKYFMALPSNKSQELKDNTISTLTNLKKGVRPAPSYTYEVNLTRPTAPSQPMEILREEQLAEGTDLSPLIRKEKSIPKEKDIETQLNKLSTKITSETINNFINHPENLTPLKKEMEDMLVEIKLLPIEGQITALEHIIKIVSQSQLQYAQLPAESIASYRASSKNIQENLLNATRNLIAALSDLLSGSVVIEAKAKPLATPIKAPPNPSKNIETRLNNLNQQTNKLLADVAETKEKNQSIPQKLIDRQATINQEMTALTEELNTNQVPIDRSSFDLLSKTAKVLINQVNKLIEAAKVLPQPASTQPETESAIYAKLALIDPQSSEFKSTLEAIGKEHNESDDEINSYIDTIASPTSSAEKSAIAMIALSSHDKVREVAKICNSSSFKTVRDQALKNKLPPIEGPDDAYSAAYSHASKIFDNEQLLVDSLLKDHNRRMDVEETITALTVGTFVGIAANISENTPEEKKSSLNDEVATAIALGVAHALVDKRQQLVATQATEKTEEQHKETVALQELSLPLMPAPLPPINIENQVKNVENNAQALKRLVGEEASPDTLLKGISDTSSSITALLKSAENLSPDQIGILHDAMEAIALTQQASKTLDNTISILDRTTEIIKNLLNRILAIPGKLTTKQVNGIGQIIFRANQIVSMAGQQLEKSSKLDNDTASVKTLTSLNELRTALNEFTGKTQIPPSSQAAKAAKLATYRGKHAKPFAKPLPISPPKKELEEAPEPPSRNSGPMPA
jgi:hypothetical protein